MRELIRLYAWSLIPNHFHFFLSVRDEEEIPADLLVDISVNELVTGCFKRFFLSYSHSLKRQQGIRTNVFTQKFRHKRITSDQQMTNLYYYVHHNPLHHGMTEDWEKYRWSSYLQIVKGRGGIVDDDFAINWFGGRDRFVRDHRLNAGKYFLEFDL